MSLVQWGVSAAAHQASSRLKVACNALGLLALCALAPAACHAGAEGGLPPTAPGAHVALAGLKPSTVDGARVAHERIQQAARELLAAAARRVCQDMQDAGGIGLLTPYSVCVDEAFRDALRQVDSVR